MLATANSANISQIVTNALGGDSDQIALAVYYNHVNTKFVQSALSGRVYVDANANVNSVFDAGEAGITGACKNCSRSRHRWDRWSLLTVDLCFGSVQFHCW